MSKPSKVNEFGWLDDAEFQIFFADSVRADDMAEIMGVVYYLATGCIAVPEVGSA